MAGSVCCRVMWDRPPSLSEPVCFSVKWIMNPSPPTSQRCLENQRQTDCKGGIPPLSRLLPQDPPGEELLSLGHLLFLEPHPSACVACRMFACSYRSPHANRGGELRVGAW